MFTVRPAGAKGFGVFAVNHIPRGTRILAERPLLSVNDASPDILAAAQALAPQDRQSLLLLSTNSRKFSSPWSLVDAIWRSLLNWSSGGSRNPALHVIRGIPRSRTILGIFYNNNFALFDEQNTRALFPTVARLNHSCTPNAQGNFNRNLGCFTVHAVHDIVRGAEITISYLHNQNTMRAARQKRLRDNYGFDCDCLICDGKSLVGEQSQGRRARLKDALAIHAEAEEKHTPSGSEDQAIEFYKRKLELTLLLIETYEQDGLAGRELASLYAAAANLTATLGNHSQAVILGARGLGLEKDAVGEDSPFYERRCLEFENLKLRGGNVPKLRSSLTPSPDTDSDLSYPPWV